MPSTTYIYIVCTVDNWTQVEECPVQLYIYICVCTVDNWTQVEECSARDWREMATAGREGCGEERGLEGRNWTAKGKLYKKNPQK